MCQNLNLLIFNGRVIKHTIVGRTNCNNKSIFDYVISSPKCLPLLRDFEILDFSPLYSDVHCPLHFTSSSPSNTTDSHEHTQITVNPEYASTSTAMPKRCDGISLNNTLKI